MEHPMPTERAENVNSMELSKTKKRTKKVNSMELSKTKKRAKKGIRKTSKTKLHSKVGQLPFTQEIKDKMILDGNTSSGLGEPSKAQLDNESEVGLGEPSKAQLDNESEAGLGEPSKVQLDNESEAGLGEPSKAQLDNESEVRMYIVFPTIKFKKEHYPTISAGPPNLEEARIWKDSHLKLLEQAAVSRASEKLCDSFDFMFSANLTEDDVKKVEGMDEVQDVLLDGFYVC